MNEPKAVVQGTCEHVAENVFIKFGYDGWVELLKILRQRIAEYDKSSARPRTELQRSRPARFKQKKASANKTKMYRIRTVEQYAPHLLPLIEAGEIKLRPAWEKAMEVKRSLSA